MDCREALRGTNKMAAIRQEVRRRQQGVLMAYLLRKNTWEQVALKVALDNTWLSSSSVLTRYIQDAS